MGNNLSTYLEREIFFPAPPASYNQEDLPLQWITYSGHPSPPPIFPKAPLRSLIHDYTYPIPIHWIVPTDKGRPLAITSGAHILYLHANACDIGQCAKEILALANELGTPFILLEYPGYGVLEAFQTSAKKIDEFALAVYLYLSRHCQIAPSQIVLFGRSIGTGPTAKLLSIVEKRFPREHIGGIILQSPYCSIESLVRSKGSVIGTSLMKESLEWGWSPLDCLANSEKGVNCLLIHGKKDSIVPWQCSEKIFADRKVKDGMYGSLVLSEKNGHNAFDFYDDLLIPIGEMLLKTAAWRLRVERDRVRDRRDGQDGGEEREKKSWGMRSMIPHTKIHRAPPGRRGTFDANPSSSLNHSTTITEVEASVPLGGAVVTPESNQTEVLATEDSKTGMEVGEGEESDVTKPESKDFAEEEKKEMEVGEEKGREDSGDSEKRLEMSEEKENRSSEEDEEQDKGVMFVKVEALHTKAMDSVVVPYEEGGSESESNLNEGEIREPSSLYEKEQYKQKTSLSTSVVFEKKSSSWLNPIFSFFTRGQEKMMDQMAPLTKKEKERREAWQKRLILRKKKKKVKYNSKSSPMLQHNIPPTLPQLSKLLPVS